MVSKICAKEYGKCVIIALWKHWGCSIDVCTSNSWPWQPRLSRSMLVSLTANINVYSGKHLTRELNQSVSPSTKLLMRTSLSSPPLRSVIYGETVNRHLVKAQTHKTSLLLKLTSFG